MRANEWRRFGVAATLYIACVAASGADTDDDALALQPEATPEAEHEASLGATKLFVEGEVGRANQRYDLSSKTLTRGAIDVRSSFRPTPATRVVLSVRADDSNPSDPRIHGTVFSFREAYVGWQDDTATRLLEFGRINLREGSGYGYNPTDFFRDNALRTISTVDPFSLREQRIGSVMLRAQQLWSSGSVAFAYSPKLDSGGRSDEGFSLDLGSTNARDRGLLTLSSRLSEKVSTQLIAYKEAGTSLRAGASLTALLSSAAVAHGEWTFSHEPDLLARTLRDHPSLEVSSKSRQRAVLGWTYATSDDLSITAEYLYNGFALDRHNWQDLGKTAGFDAQSAYLGKAVALQDNPTRDGLLIYAVQRNFIVKQLDLTALAKFNHDDQSKLLWVDIRYKFQNFDVALRLQQTSGTLGSEFGTSSIVNVVSTLAVCYF